MQPFSCLFWNLFGELDIQNFKGSSSDKGDIKVGFEYKKQTWGYS